MMYYSHKTLAALFTLLLIVILGYTLFAARHVLTGPQVRFGDVENPLTVHTQVIELSGQASNTQGLTINNRKVLMDQSGAFSERVLLSVGLNTFSFTAIDRFGRSKTSVFEVVYEPQTKDVLQLRNNDTNIINDAYDGNTEDSEQ